MKRKPIFDEVLFEFKPYFPQRIYMHRVIKVGKQVFFTECDGRRRKFKVSDWTETPIGGSLHESFKEAVIAAADERGQE